MFRILLDTLTSRGTKTILGSGLHHIIKEPWSNHGKIPSEYASMSRLVDKSPPTATTPSAVACSTGGNFVFSVRKTIIYQRIVKTFSKIVLKLKFLLVLSIYYPYFGSAFVIKFFHHCFFEFTAKANLKPQN